MKIVEGDLIKLALEGNFDVIIHGCNCFRTMGKGIASTIKRVFPQAYEADRETIGGDVNKLGDYSLAVVKKSFGQIAVVNAYTQFRYNPKYGMDGKHADYDAIRSVFRKIKEDMHGMRIGYPKIGAGLAGGDWSVISKIIDEELEGEDHTLVVLP